MSAEIKKLDPVAHDCFEDLWFPRYHPPFPAENLGFRNVPRELWSKLQESYLAFEAASDAIDKWTRENER